MRNFLTRREDDLGFNFFHALDDFFKPTYYGGCTKMRTDIKEIDNGYELSIDMPGYDKKDINLSLENGYLTVEAKKQEVESGEKYLHRERTFSCSRTFYVGGNVTEEDIKAKYQNGTLTLEVPKNEAKQIEKKKIEIQ